MTKAQISHQTFVMPLTFESSFKFLKNRLSLSLSLELPSNTKITIVRIGLKCFLEHVKINTLFAYNTQHRFKFIQHIRCLVSFNQTDSAAHIQS